MSKKLDIQAFSTYGVIGNVKQEARLICDCLGYGINYTAHLLLIETACAETGLGNIKDRTISAGLSFIQMDNCKPYYTFDDLKKRSMKYREKIKKGLGIDISLVEWEHLRYSTSLALLFCRLYYLPFQKQIPDDIEGRAAYWKKYYNTKDGKGSVEHYLMMCRKYYPMKP